MSNLPTLRPAAQLIARELVRMEQLDLAEDLRDQLLEKLKDVCSLHFELLNVKDPMKRGERLAYELLGEAQVRGGSHANIVRFDRPLA